MATALPRSFFIYDRALCKTEADPPDKMIVYIHPEDTPKQVQSYLAGVCSAMEEYLARFSSSAPRVFTLERDKFVMKKVGQWVLVLLGSVTQPDSSLCYDLDMIYSALCFFSGSIRSIFMGVKQDEDEFVLAMQEHCRELVPFVTRLCPFGGTFSFMATTRLPPHCNRLFLVASDILHTLRAENDNLAGIIMFDNTVLCTHINQTLSSHIYTRVNHKYRQRAVQPHTPTSAGVDFVSEIVTVFVDTATLKALRAGRPAQIEVSADIVPVRYYPDLPSGEISQEADNTEIDAAPIHAPHADGEYVGLYHLVLNHVTLTVLMNFAAIYNERHINVTRTLVSNKLANLEKKLTKTLELAVGNERSAPNFQYVAYDQETLQLRASGLDTNDVDPRFRHTVGVQHEIFATTGAELVILRDANGTVLGRKMHDQEIMFANAFASGLAGHGHGGLPSSGASANSISMQPGIGVQRPGFISADFRTIEERATENLQELSVQLL